MILEDFKELPKMFGNFVMSVATNFAKFIQRKWNLHSRAEN